MHCSSSHVEAGSFRWRFPLGTAALLLVVVGCSTNILERRLLEWSAVPADFILPVSEDGVTVTHPRSADLHVTVDASGVTRVYSSNGQSLKALQDLAQYGLEPDDRVFFWIDQRCNDATANEIIRIFRRHPQQSMYRIVRTPFGIRAKASEASRSVLPSFLIP